MQLFLIISGVYCLAKYIRKFVTLSDNYRSRVLQDLNRVRTIGFDVKDRVTDAHVFHIIKGGLNPFISDQEVSKHVEKRVSFAFELNFKLVFCFGKNV